MKHVYFLLFAALCAVPAHSMNWRQRLVAGLYTSGKALSIGFPIGFGAVKAGERVYYQDDFISDLEKTFRPATPQVESWCHKHMVSCGEEFAHTPIKIWSRAPSDAFALHNFIGISSSLAERIMAKPTSAPAYSSVDNRAQATWLQAFLKQGDDIAGVPVILRHEAGHVYYCDTTLSSAVGTIIGSTTLAQLAASGMTSLRKPKLPPTTIGRGVLALCMGGIGGLAKVCAGDKLQTSYIRYQEYRADSFANEHTDSIEELESRAKTLENYHENFLANMVAKTAYSEWRNPELEWRAFKNSPLWMQNIRSRIGFLAFDQKHPHPLKRAQRARAAADALKRKTVAT